MLRYLLLCTASYVCEEEKLKYLKNATIRISIFELRKTTKYRI